MRKRHAFAAAGPLSANEPRQTFAMWARLWGSPGERKPILDLALTRTLDLDQFERMHLDRLALPVQPAGRSALPGADLTLLGIVKKPANPR